MTKLHQVYIISLTSPTRNIKLISVILKVCKKHVWAIDSFGKRYLLGCSAFQTEASAKRAQRGLCEKLVGNSYLQRLAPWTVQRAKHILTLH